MKEMDDNRDRIKLLNRFLTVCHKDYAKQVMDAYNKLDKDEQDEFFENIFNERIYIQQEPMGAVTGDDLNYMYNEFQPKLSTIYVEDQDGKFKLRRKAIVAEEYILILKHLASSKFSVRSKGMINPKTALPTKSLKAKKKKTLFADQATKIGNLNCRL